ncbi:MAG: hypothetical protein ACI4MH_04735 [Candidatus Coproplasma sp.]
MKIVIKDGESSHRFVFRFPTSIMKWKWIYSLALKFVDDDNTKDTISPFMDNSKRIYVAIKKYIRANGHFVLVDVQSSNGDVVKITV